MFIQQIERPSFPIERAINEARVVSENTGNAMWVWSCGGFRYTFGPAVPYADRRGFLAYVCGDEVFWAATAH